MLAEHTNKPLLKVVKTYLRCKDKKSFPVMLKLPIVLSDLKETVLKKTKIPEDDLIVMLQGKQIDFSNQHKIIQLKDKSILHIIDKNNLRNDILELLIRMILRNQEKSCLGQVKLFAKTDQPIEQFIEKQLLPAIQERTNKKLQSDSVNLVSNGTVLNKKLNFHHYLIENGAEIICMINFMEDLQKSVKNISTHKLIGFHRQIELYRLLDAQSEKNKQKIAKQEKKTLETKEPKKEFETKQHQKNTTAEDQESKVKLERKQNINPKFYQPKQKGKFSPTLYPQFSDLLNKDITDGWQEKQPQSPISIEYPKAQKSETKVEWYDQKEQQKKEDFKKEFKLQQEQNIPLVKSNQERKEELKEETNIKLGDFLIKNQMRSNEERQSHQEFLEDMSDKISTFFNKKSEESLSSQIAIEYPSLEKKISVKPGDFIICGDMVMNSTKLINETLLQKFNSLIQKRTKKIQQDYDLEQRLKEDKTYSKTVKTPQISSI